LGTTEVVPKERLWKKKKKKMKEVKGPTMFGKGRVMGRGLDHPNQEGNRE